MSSTLEPLPFHLKDPGEDTIGWLGITSVSYRADGRLLLVDEGVRLEWTERQTTERLSVRRTGTDVELLSPEWLTLPFDRVAGAWLVGGWWWPRLEVRVHEIADLKDVPGTRGVTVPLRIRRQNRALARAVAEAIQARATPGAQNGDLQDT